MAMDLDDAELARRLSSAPEGWPEGEAELFRRFASRIRLYGLRHLRDDQAADDLVQDVLVVTIRRLRAGEVREPERLGSFVLGTCRHLARDLSRTARRRDGLLRGADGPPVAAAPAPDEPLDADRLRSCLEELPPRERTVIVMTFFAERDAADIGRELSMTEGNVRVVRHRALARLRGCMEPPGAGR